MRFSGMFLPQKEIYLKKRLTYIPMGMYYLLCNFKGCDVLPRKTKEDSQITRSRLLESALDVFSRKSFSDVTLSEIAEKVGMTKGALYWHFKSKNDIFLKLVEEICLDAEKQFSEKYGEPETLADLREHYRRRLIPPDKDDRFMKVHALMLRRFEWPEEVRSNVFSILKDRIKRENKIVCALLIKSRNEGLIKQDIDPMAAASAITSVFYGLFILAVNEIVAEDLSEYADFICDAFKKELTARD